MLTLSGLAFGLLPLVPSVRALLGLSIFDVAVALLANAAILVPTTLAYRHGGSDSRAYRALATLEALVLQGSALWIVYRSGRADSPAFVVYVVFAAINVRYTAHAAVLRVLIGLPPLVLALAYATMRDDVASALVSLVMGGFALVVYEAGMRANRRLREVLDERAALEARLAAERIHAERTRIARELHDGLGAELAALMWRAERIRADLAVGAREELGTLIERAGYGIDELRSVVWALRSPSMSWGALTAYVRERCNELCIGRLQLEVKVIGDDDAEVSGEVAIDLIRAAQESIRNVVRHARASQVQVTLERAARITLTVEDDGVGVPALALDRDRGGLANLRQRMRARGGECTITPASPRGTRIRASLPLGPLASAER